MNIELGLKSFICLNNLNSFDVFFTLSIILSNIVDKEATDMNYGVIYLYNSLSYDFRQGKCMCGIANNSIIRKNGAIEQTSSML